MLDRSLRPHDHLAEKDDRLDPQLSNLRMLGPPSHYPAVGLALTLEGDVWQHKGLGFAYWLFVGEGEQFYP